MTQNEMIEAWKKNLDYFGSMPDEMRKLAKEIGISFFWVYDVFGSMVDAARHCRVFEENLRYRLKDDYTPPTHEPEIIEVPVETYKGEKVITRDDMIFSLAAAPFACEWNGKKVNFMGAKFDEVPGLNSCVYMHDVISKNMARTLYPKSILYRVINP